LNPSLIEHQYTAHSLEDYTSIAEQVLDACKNVRIFALYGTLGAGKTTFVKRLCAALGVIEPVSSPTFGLVHTYLGNPGEVYHFDFYRIEAEEEVYQIGVEEYFDSGNYVFIEWPERISGLLPDDIAHIFIRVVEGTQRQIELSYTAHGED